MGVADFSGAAEGLLFLQPINRRLDRGVGGSLPLREGFLNFADRAGPSRPENLHDLKLQLSEFRDRHR